MASPYRRARRDHVFTHEGDAGVHCHTQLKGGWSGVQPNERAHISRGNVKHNPDLSLEVNRRIRNTWCNFRKYSLELYNRPSASLELKPRMLTAEILEIMPYDCIMRRPRACHNDTLHQTHDSFLTRCIGWQNNNTDNSISNLDTAMKTGGESMEAIKRSEAYRVCGSCGAHGGQKIAEVLCARRTVGGRGLRGGSGKKMDGMFLRRPRSFRYQLRPVDDYSPGQG